MGRVTTQTPSAAVKHFTHPHNLHPLSMYSPQSVCSGCNLRSSGIMYTCIPCNFTLHQSCAKLPQLITHPSHRGCTLSLLTLSSYPSGRFSCNACALTGDSWNYHCARCEYDLHVTCASKPLMIRIPSHSSCHLHLTFNNPYSDSKGFSCDICRKIGSKQWLYRCNSCEFDVHLDCTQAVPHPISINHNHQLVHSASTGGMHMLSAPLQVNGLVGLQPYLMHSVSAGAIGNQYPVAGVGYGGMVMNNAAMQNNQAGNLGGNIMAAALQGFVECVGQAVVQDFVGTDGGDEASY